MVEPSWTTRQLLQWTSGHFKKKGLEHPRLSAEMLLAHVLGVGRLQLYMDADRPAGELERAAFRDLVERATAQEPVDYLVGRSPFFSLMLKVSPAVLIPRPSTETLVEHVLTHARRTPGFHTPRVADIGTGSGTIAIALAKHMVDARIVATDIEPDALAVARANAKDQKVDDRIVFRQGDLVDPLEKAHYSYLVSNPPYISDAEWAQVAPNVKDYEPAVALRAGPDGLKYIRVLIERAAEYLTRPGQLVIEIAASQKQAVIQLVEATQDLFNPQVLVDHEQLPRVLVAERR